MSSVRRVYTTGGECVREEHCYVYEPAYLPLHLQPPPRRLGYIVDGKNSGRSGWPMTGTDLEDRREGITTDDSGNDRDESVTRLLRGCRSGMGLFGAIGFFEVDSIDDESQGGPRQSA